MEMNEEPETGPPAEVEPGPRKKRRSTKLAVIAGIVIVLAAAGLLLWRFLPGSKDGGRVISAPPSLGRDLPSDRAPISAGESTVDLTAEQLQQSGLVIETVGERVAADSNGQPTTGLVQPNSYRETPATSLVGGIVRSISPQLGQNVRKGQIIAVVSSNELSEVQANYLTALAALDEHHRHHIRTEKLVAIGAASQQELEQATSNLRAAESALAELRQRLLILGLSTQRVGALRSSSQINSEVGIPAPANGTVTSRAVNSGEVIEANKELLRITDLSSVWIVGQVYEKDLGKVHVGVGASISTDAYPGRIFRGQVSYVDPKVDPQTRTAQARVELANPGGTLKIGMYVNVSFSTLAAGLTIPIVPVVAVQNLGNRQVVFVTTDDPKVFAMRTVRIGPETTGFFPVLEGLTVGERVVGQGSFLLRAEWLRAHPNWQL